MKKSSSQYNLGQILLLLLLVGSVLVGCASPPAIEKAAPPPPPLPRADWEKVAEARANARWAAIVKKDFAAAFAMYTESSRKVMTEDGLRGAIKQSRMLSGTVDRVECDAEKCDVWVNVMVMHRIPRVGNKQQMVPFKEVWVPEKGTLHLIRD
jgi:hypothetical protein